MQNKDQPLAVKGEAANSKASEQGSDGQVRIPRDNFFAEKANLPEKPFIPPRSANNRLALQTFTET